MPHHSRSTAIREAKAPKLSSGRSVGRYSVEAGLLVWTRNVSTKHLLRFLDGWTINAGLLHQLVSDGVAIIRYVSSDGRTYAVSAEGFQAGATLLKGFAHGEDVHALPRSQWEDDGETAGRQLLLLFKRDGD